MKIAALFVAADGPYSSSALTRTRRVGRRESGAGMNISTGHGLTYLECPCRGDNGAASDGEGCFYDGQALICGCPGLVSVDSDGDEDPWINNGDAPCQRCSS